MPHYSAVLVRCLLAIGIVAPSVILVMVIIQPDLALRLHRRLLPQTEQEPTAFWNESLAYQLRLDPSAAHAVFFIGDSLVQSLHVGGIVAEAVNYGIGGDTIRGVRRRVPLYHSLAEARAIVLAIGVNDLLVRDASAAASDYAALLDELPANLPLVLSAVLPVDEAMLGRGARRLTNAGVQQLNATIERLCAQRKKCIFVDVGAELRDREGRLAGALQVGDGVHLNAGGYRIWSTALARALSTLLKEG